VCTDALFDHFDDFLSLAFSFLLLYTSTHWLYSSLACTRSYAISRCKHLSCTRLGREGRSEGVEAFDRPAEVSGTDPPSALPNPSAVVVLHTVHNHQSHHTAHSQVSLPVHNHTHLAKQARPRLKRQLPSQTVRGSTSIVHVICLKLARPRGGLHRSGLRPDLHSTPCVGVLASSSRPPLQTPPHPFPPVCLHITFSYPSDINHKPRHRGSGTPASRDSASNPPSASKPTHTHTLGRRQSTYAAKCSAQA